MTPKEYWKRINAEEAAGFREQGAAGEHAARYLAWHRGRRRARRRKIARIGLGTALSGAGVVMLIVSLSTIRGAKTAHRAGSTLPPVVPAEAGRSADPGADAMLSQRSQVAMEETRQSAGGSPAPLVLPRRATGTATGDRRVQDSHHERRVQHNARESASPSMREQPTASNLSERPVPAGVAAHRNEPAIATFSGDNETTRVPGSPGDSAIQRRATTSGPAMPIDADTRSSAASPQRVDPAATMPEHVPLVTSLPSAKTPPAVPPDQRDAALALVARLRQAIALTPAEAQRLEKIKTALGYVPEVWLAKRVIRWVKSSRMEIDQAPTDAHIERPVEAP
jgi:hypothetical protein